MCRLTERKNAVPLPAMSPRNQEFGFRAGDGFSLIQGMERERSESIQSHQFGLMNPDQLNNEDLLLRSNLCGRGEGAGHALGNIDQEDVDLSDTIFAVNRDVDFLYMIGKMCNESGHNLFQGLLALNDYYLFSWHYGQSNIQKLSEDTHKNGPLTSQSSLNASSHRIQDCVKTLLVMAEICEKLQQPRLALQLYLKILEDRETLNKYLGCKKWVWGAEAGLGRVWQAISWHHAPGASAVPPKAGSNPAQRQQQPEVKKEIVGALEVHERVQLVEDHFGPSSFPQLSSRS